MWRVEFDTRVSAQGAVYKSPIHACTLYIIALKYYLIFFLQQTLFQEENRSEGQLRDKKALNDILCVTKKHTK